MSNITKTYFLAPSWDYPPNGPIKLGNIISSPLKAAEPLNIATCKDPEEVDLNPPFKIGVTWSKEKQRAGKFGVWTEFLSFLGFGVDVGTSYDTQIEETYAFDRMDTKEFLPTPAYLAESIRDPAVARFLDKSRLRKSLYMITGIKTVAGAKAKRSVHSTRAGEIKVGHDGTFTGAPVYFGPEMVLSRKDKEVAAFHGSSDFVFAFRVRKITVKRGQEISSDDYTKGALYDAEARPTQDEESILFPEMEPGDYHPTAFGSLTICSVVENEAPCLCVVPEL